MLLFKRFTLLSFFILSSLALAGCGDNIGGGNGANGEAGSKEDITEIDLKSNPLSLIGAYSIDNYSIGNTGDTSAKSKDAGAGSELRVNITMALSVKIQIGLVIKPNVGSSYLTSEIKLSNDIDIAKIFTDLGAEVVDSKHLKFTMTSEKYPELVSNGMMKDGETLTINITKTKDLQPGEGLGNDFEVKPGPETPVDSVSISYNGQTSETILKGSDLVLESVVLPNNADNKILSYTSSDKTVATVTDGTISAVSAGTATITATSNNGKSSTFIVTVVVASSEISFPKSVEGVPLNGTATFAAKVEGEDSTANDRIVYTSSNPSIASVINGGIVTGHSLTNATPITITATYTKADGTKILTSYSLNIFTPVDFNNPESLKGAYEITFFGTYPKGSSSIVEVIVTSDCSVFSTLFLKADGFSKTCKTGTGGNALSPQNEVNNFHGLLTIDKNATDELSVKSKIMMTNSVMSSSAPDDQYQYSEYTPTSESNAYNDPNAGDVVKGITGRNLTSKTSNPESTFQILTKEENVIKIDMVLKNKKVLIGTVDAYTKLFAKKISDAPKTLDPNTMDDEPFKPISGFLPTPK